MPQSKGRQKRRSGRYQLEPQRKQPRKASPRWYGPLILGIMALGVIVIVWNYLRGAENASNMVLISGIGLIGLGFLGTMFWR
jgi:hypothetical protein